MTDRQIKAYEYFKQGHNCAQAVLLPFSDVLHIDEDLLERFSAAFGGGFAKTRNLCGAVSAIGMIVGLLSAPTDDAQADKENVYKTTRILTDKFVASNKSLVCGELLKDMKNITSDYAPSPRTEEYYKARPCIKLVLDSVLIIEEYLETIKQ